MKVLVCGDRYWGVDPTPAPGVSEETLQALRERAHIERETLFSYLDELYERETITEIIEGEAPGADLLGRRWAEERGVAVRPFRAKWREQGRAAGPIRNKLMLVEGQPDFVAAFHNNIHLSKGTKNMVLQTRRAQIPYDVIVAY